MSKDKKKDVCGESVIRGGAFEWRCILRPHEDDGPDSHYFVPHKKIV